MRKFAIKNREEKRMVDLRIEVTTMDETYASAQHRML